MLQTKLLISCAIFALSSFANATVIDFNHLAHNDTSQAFSTISSNGFVIKNDSQGSDRLGVWGRNDEFQADTGHAAVFVNYSGSKTSIERANKSFFNFKSIDLADVFNNGDSATIKFSFFNGQSTTFETVILDQLKGLQTIVFNKNNLTKVSWVGSNSQFDNINVSAPVPEPETYALLGMGLMSLWIARRRKHA
ncbi:PEP-CTERM sorting domain-containing protein [Iodobacter arcticus]|uniref:PEP-CTERM sorting domain-containing protein n=1 Tax=Iodobacter arcticus TaxID=590593 RepID=A0ABW2R117_9NEIS